jgi:CO dehydrogenase/acetyl-CoA synthase gamma subunit (corrinoid Fe-S protein)
VLGEVVYREDNTYFNQTTTLWDIYQGSLDEGITRKIEKVLKDFKSAIVL